MSDSPGHGAILAVVAALLPTETIIYSWQSTPEAPRPTLPYAELRTVDDTAAGLPLDDRTILGAPSGPSEDVRVSRSQMRTATVRVYCYGPSAMARARRVAFGLDSPSVLHLWGSTGLSCDGRVVDASETLGNHHERVAYCDVNALYRDTVQSDHFSIQTLDLTVST